MVNGVGSVKLRLRILKRSSQHSFKSNDEKKFENHHAKRLVLSWGVTKCHHDVFVGIEHRLRGDELVEMLHKASKRYGIAADDVRAAKDSEVVGMEISGGVFVDVANRLTSAGPVDGVEIDSLEVNESRIAEAWVECHQGMHVFTLYLWHSEGWPTRSEELVKSFLRRVANTKSLWIIVCDANMEPREFQFCDWYVKALASGVSFYGAKSADGKKC